MKKKLIDYQSFEKINESSLTTTEQELIESQDVLTRALDMEDLKLHCFSPESVIYESIDGTFIHATYQIKDKEIEFDNIEQLIIDETTERTKSKGLIKEMITAVAENKIEAAGAMFDRYISMPGYKSITEAYKLRAVPIRKNGKIVGYRKARWHTGAPKHHEPSWLSAKRARARRLNSRKRPVSQKNLLKIRREKIRRQISEWASVCENILSYLDIKEFGPVLQESVASYDNRGNITKLSIPREEVRQEVKWQTSNWKLANNDVKKLRNEAKSLDENVEFAKEIAILKRCNAMSDNQALEESLENIVKKYPQVLYLTQNELAENIHRVLGSVNATNYDNETCLFMAEGILRVAHNSYLNRVDRICRLAGHPVAGDSQDKYLEFKAVVDGFYNKLDEGNLLEMQAFVDLYSTIRAVYEAATQENNEIVKNEASEYLSDLADVINQKEKPTLETLSNACDWLADLLESNLEAMNPTPHVSTNGDHPALAGKAGVSGTPDTGMKPEEVGAGLGDESENCYPNIANPYMPKSGEFKVNDEAGVGLGDWSSSDTFPELNNPYVPKSVKPVADE